MIKSTIGAALLLLAVMTSATAGECVPNAIRGNLNQAHHHLRDAVDEIGRDNIAGARSAAWKAHENMSVTVGFLFNCKCAPPTVHLSQAAQRAATASNTMPEYTSGYIQSALRSLRDTVQSINSGECRPS